MKGANLITVQQVPGGSSRNASSLMCVTLNKLTDLPHCCEGKTTLSENAPSLDNITLKFIGFLSSVLHKPLQGKKKIKSP